MWHFILKCLKDMLDINPCKELEIFFFERCFLHEATFFYLLSKLPNIRHIGNLEEWFMDMGAIARIREFLRVNNIDVDIDSHRLRSYAIRGGV